MRTACSSGETKILPSPIWPVLAAAAIASTTLSTCSVAHRDLDLQLRQEAHGIFGAAVDFRVALLAAVAFDLGDGQALHAEPVSASRTSSSLNGLMMAITIFMMRCSLRCPSRRRPRGCAEPA